MKYYSQYRRTVKSCNKRDVYKRQLQELKERHKEIQTDVSERVERVYTTINKIDEETQENKEKIRQISQKEKQMQEELDTLKAVSYTHLDVYKRQELPSTLEGITKKLLLLYTGPYLIVKNNNNNTYVLKDINSNKVKGTYNQLSL